MKTLIFITCLLLLNTGIYAQMATEEASNEIKATYGNIKTLTSELEEEVKIEIRKPDDSSIMTRKQTDFDYLQKREMEEKLKKSNKMLY